MADEQLSFSTIVGSFLKRNYGRGSTPIREMQNLKAHFFSKLPVSPEKPTGDGFFIPINVEGNESGRASNESEAFANPQSVNDQQFRIRAKHTFWPFQLTGFSMEVATSNVDSFTRSLDRQQRDNLSRMMSDMNRQAVGQGTGVLSQVDGAVAASTSITVDDIIPFRVGMRIDVFVTLAGALEAQNVRITGITTSTKTLTVDTSVTLSDNAVIVKTGVNTNAPTDGKELFGAEALIDDTTLNTNLQNLSKTTYPVLQSEIVDLASGSITNQQLQKLETGVENRSNDLVSEVWSARGQRDKYLELLTPLKRFVNDDAMDSGKRKPVEWNGKPWYVDKDFSTGIIIMKTERSIEKFVIKEPDIVDRDGSTIRALPGADVYQGYYAAHMNLGTLTPNSHGKIINAAEPS